MFESFLVVFRESLEAALIVGIVCAFLKRNKLTKIYPLVLTSIAAAVGASLFGAYLFSLLENGFTGLAEQVFEGITMILAALFLSYMIIWLYQQKNPKTSIEEKLLKNSSRAGLFFLVFFAILREGIETVLFLNAISFNATGGTLWGAFAGLFIALVIGYLLFVVEIKLPVKRFFQVSSVLLILFAAGLLAHGIHEFQEAGIIPIAIEHLYDINGILDENTQFGQILKGVFGYNGNPSLIETLSYVTYATVAFWLFFRNDKIDKKRK
jgi:high-affinity iron transporter